MGFSTSRFPNQLDITVCWIIAAARRVSTAGIAPASVPMFVLMQLIGGVLALGLVRYLFATPVPEVVR